MKVNDLFPKRKEHYLELIAVCLILLALAFVTSSPNREYYLDNPVPEDPVIVFIFGVVALMCIYSWFCCGSDHEENVSLEHPDGQLTYPGDKQNE